MFGVPFTPILPSIHVTNGKTSPPNRRQQQPGTPSSPGMKVSYAVNFILFHS